MNALDATEERLTEPGEDSAKALCQERLLSLIPGAHTVCVCVRACVCARARAHICSPNTPVRAGESLQGQKQWDRRDPALVKWEERTGFESPYRPLPPLLSFNSAFDRVLKLTMQNRLGLNLQGASAGLTGEVYSAHLILTAISRKLYIYNININI